ncbi:hypothetical protein R1flu_013213 [Riccia fluitans]|uniref:Uncharacterized protein n=1 Tax=Riccia fluitans TaxID=41844 RepID=A0ABD1YFS4_9MARC
MSGSDDATVDNPMFQLRNGRANAEDAPLHRIMNCLTMRQWRRLIGLCRMRRPTPESVLFSFARGAAGAQGQLPVNLSREGLKEYLVFPGIEDSSHVVSASVIEAEFLRRTGHKSLKDAWMTVAPGSIIGIHSRGRKGGL